MTGIARVLDVETIAKGRGIQELRRLTRQYGNGNWLKRKGIGRVRLASGMMVKAEIRWNEADDIGKVDFKVKRYLQALWDLPVERQDARLARSRQGL